MKTETNQKKFTIPVTQFIRPHRGIREETTEISEELRPKFELMQKLGCRLTAEVLPTGHVSLCIEQPSLGDVDCRIATNGPQVQEKIEAMLGDFTGESFNQFKEVMS